MPGTQCASWSVIVASLLHKRRLSSHPLLNFAMQNIRLTVWQVLYLKIVNVKLRFGGRLQVHCKLPSVSWILVQVYPTSKIREVRIGTVQCFICYLLYNVARCSESLQSKNERERINMIKSFHRCYLSTSVIPLFTARTAPLFCHPPTSTLTTIWTNFCIWE